MKIGKRTLKKEDLNENLVSFLIEHDALHKFIDNINIQHKDPLSVISKYRIEDSILFSFTWDETKEGGIYWGELHDKLVDYWNEHENS